MMMESISTNANRQAFAPARPLEASLYAVKGNNEILIISPVQDSGYGLLPDLSVRAKWDTIR